MSEIKLLMYVTLVRSFGDLIITQRRRDLRSSSPPAAVLKITRCRQQAAMYSDDSDIFLARILMRHGKMVFL